MIWTQYRSEIFYISDQQKEIAIKVLNKINIKLNGKVVTNISKHRNYCKAEEYHQKYLENKSMSLVSTEWLFKNKENVKLLIVLGIYLMKKIVSLSII